MGEKVFVGIDPGKTGAVAYLSSNEIKVFDFEDLEGFLYLRRLAFDILDSRNFVAVIEKVGAMPGQGVSSMFNFGQNVGIWKGRLEMAGVAYTEATPRKWQKEIFDSGVKKGMDRKELSLNMARKLFPSMLEFLKRKKDHGRADALLIAEYCRRINI